MGCTNTKVHPEPVGAGVEAWSKGKGRGGAWRGLLDRIRVPVCRGSTKVVPIGIMPDNCNAIDRSDFNTPVNGAPVESNCASVSDSATNGDYESADTQSQSRPGSGLPSPDAGVMEVVDLESEQANMNSIEYFASRSYSPLPDRLPVKRVRKERPPSRGGLQVELALYGKNATRPLPSCLSRAVLNNNFQDRKLKDDVTRAERRHLETQLDSYQSHNGWRAPSAAHSCLDAFMEYERKCAATKFGRKLHQVSESPEEEETES